MCQELFEFHYYLFVGAFFFSSTHIVKAIIFLSYYSIALKNCTIYL